MKIKYSLFFSLALLLSLFACRKETTTINNNLTNDKIDANSLLEVRSFDKETSMKLAYATLNAFEQEALWRENIQHYINNGGLNEAQIIHLKDLLSKLTPEMFEKRDQSNITFANSWARQASSVFTQRQLILMLTQLKLSTKEELNAVGNNRLTKTAECDPVVCPAPLEWDPTVCMCVQPTGEKPWCTCKIENSVFTLCTGQFDKCKDPIPECKRITFCGFLYLEDCDAQCKVEIS